MSDPNGFITHTPDEPEKSLPLQSSNKKVYPKIGTIKDFAPQGIDNTGMQPAPLSDEENDTAETETDKIVRVEMQEEEEVSVEEDASEPFNWDLAIRDKENVEWVDIQHKRIREIPPEALNLPKCEYVCLRYNLIKDISNVSYLNPAALTELDLYDNHIKTMNGIENLVNLELLDLSYNNIKVMKNLEKLSKLKKLYLCSNKISNIECLDSLVGHLEVLELGNNKIKVIENLPKFQCLKELHFAKNKISEIPELHESIKE